MVVISTQTPAYLDYVASAYTRDEILADPDFCRLLENPYLKDNMELALAWNEARRSGGNVEAQKNFVEYLICNGPELDADTILFYREKCIAEPVYLQIFQVYFADMDKVDLIRKNKYKKDILDCFTKPCNYLGRFSAAMGTIGDSQNFRTLKNMFSYKRKIIDEKGNEKVEEVMGVDAVWGDIRRHLINKIIPDMRVAAQCLYNNMHTKLSSFNKSLAEAGLGKGIPLGDPYAIPRAEMVSAATKLNIVSRLGDCTKLWQHMRSFNPFDPTQNKKGPIPASALVGNKNINGVSTVQPQAASTKSYLSETDLKKLSAQGDKEAQAILEKEKTCQEKANDAVRAMMAADAQLNKTIKTVEESTHPQVEPKVTFKPVAVETPSLDSLLVDTSKMGAMPQNTTSILESSFGDLGTSEAANDFVQDLAGAINSANSGDPFKSTPEMMKDQQKEQTPS